MLVGFEIWQQALIDTWLPALEGIADGRGDLRTYELALIRRSLLPARSAIDGGMVAGIPNEAVRARTLTAYTDLPRALAALGLPDTRDMALFLVERDGGICWRTVGGCTPAQAASLEQAPRTA